MRSRVAGLEHPVFARGGRALPNRQQTEVSLFRVMIGPTMATVPPDFRTSSCTCGKGMGNTPFQPLVASKARAYRRILRWDWDEKTDRDSNLTARERLLVLNGWFSYRRPVCPRLFFPNTSRRRQRIGHNCGDHPRRARGTSSSAAPNFRLRRDRKRTAAISTVGGALSTECKRGISYGARYTAPPLAVPHSPLRVSFAPARRVAGLPQHGRQRHGGQGDGCSLERHSRCPIPFSDIMGSGTADCAGYR